MFSRLPRFQHLLRCLIECRRIRQDGISVGSALELSRSLSARAWDNTPLVMKQLRGVGPVTVRKLRDLGIKTFDDLRITPVELLDRCGKNTLFGTKLLSAAREFPSLRITASVQRKVCINSSWMKESNNKICRTHSIAIQAFTAVQKLASSMLRCL